MALVRFEKQNDVLRVSLNRTHVLNALNSELIEELETGIRSYSRDVSIKVLILFGQGGCFAAGADIQELAELDEAGIRRFHHLRERTFSLLEHFPSPTLALIERYALGTGLELALCCDVRICADTARLGVPSAKLGIVESFEYLSRLVRTVGSSQAKKLVFTGESVDAKTAFSMGLVEEMTSPDTLFNRAQELSDTFSQNSSYSLRESKKVIHACAGDPYLKHVEDPAAPMVTSLKTKDFIEGTQAFLEKRKATFT